MKRLVFSLINLAFTLLVIGIFLKNLNPTENKLIEIDLMNFFMIWIIYSVGVLILKLLVYIRLHGKNGVDKKSNFNSYSGLENKRNELIHTFGILTSIDYVISDFLKNKMKEKNKDTALLLKYFNYENLLISSILLIVVCLCEWNIILALTYMRVVSRGFEIIMSFLNDILSPKKTSKLNNQDRIWLAIVSLIEITLLFTIIYMEWSSFLESVVFSIGTSTLLDVNLTYEVTKGKLVSFTKLKMIAVTFHVIIAAVLIILSLAQYIGNTESRNIVKYTKQRVRKKRNI